MLIFSTQEADTVTMMNLGQTHTIETVTVETLASEIGRIVAERQELRARGASAAALEENRRLLAAAQAKLSQLLIARYLPERSAAA